MVSFHLQTPQNREDPPLDLFCITFSFRFTNIRHVVWITQYKLISLFSNCFLQPTSSGMCDVSTAHIPRNSTEHKEALKN